MLQIDIDKLSCSSVIDRGDGALVTKVALGQGDPPIDIFRIADVLYLPSALLEGQSLQIVDRHILPLEAVLYEFTAEFVKAQMPLEIRTMYLNGLAFRRIKTDVCILGNVFSRNFTHWHEELMKVVLLERAGIGCSYVVSNLPPFTTELLALIGIVDNRVLRVESPAIFRSALFTTPVGYQNLSSYPGVLHGLRETLLSIDASGQPAIDSRLWFHREAQARLGRKLVNAEEVYKCLERHGVKAVDFGALPLRSQIAAARGAEVMAGTHGSHFVHSQLMKTRSSVIECFSPLYLNPTYTEIYRVLRHRYCQISGTNTPVFPYRHGTDVEVDCAQLELALQEVS
jgi:capsular polysaccharide biosynthesis protein